MGTLLIFLLALGFQPAPTEAGDQVVATVNKVDITSSQLDQAIAAYKARAKKIAVTDEEKVALIHSLIQRQLLLTQDAVEAFRKDEEIAKNVREYENSLIIRRFLQDRIGSRLQVTEDEVKTYYQENLEKFVMSPRVAARHILLKTREDAEKVRAKLQKGADFGEMAKEYSIDLPMSLEGGSMGIIEKGKTLPELEEVLFSLKEGEVSDIVETRFGLHLLTVDSITLAQNRPYEQVREQINKMLLQLKEAEFYQEFVAGLEKGAEIKIFENRLAEAAF
jgi:parvulin-like peptidyl-prolyl isomerase